MRRAALWLQHCGMTCWGGSEARQCGCRGPQDCEMQNHPDFEAEKAKAWERMCSYFGVPEWVRAVGRDR